MQQLIGYDWPSEVEIVGERPRKPEGAAVSERYSGYRTAMSAYIERCTGIKVGVNSSVTMSFYDRIADPLGL